MKQSELWGKIDCIKQLASTAEGTLEQHLRAMYHLALPYQAEKLSIERMLWLLEQSLTAEPAPFLQEWLQSTSSPWCEWDEEQDSYCDEYSGKLVTEWDYFEQTILFQIADLHRMDEVGILANPYRSMGMDSPTGHRWHNYSLFMYLKCGIGAYDLDSSLTEERIDWGYLAQLLQIGRNYE